MTTALFLLKMREDYAYDQSYSGSYQIATGMWNSAKFVADSLNANYIDAKVEIIVDGNDIDRIITLRSATAVFIEGLWVTPEKLKELHGMREHLGRTFIVRIHSEIPFLATEGTAMAWIADYWKNGIVVAPNSPRAYESLQNYARAIGYSEAQIKTLCVYLPNCYPIDFTPITSADLDTRDKTVLDIGCFGAFRPMKNQLFSALLAVQFAKLLGKDLNFHINDRVDAAGQGPYSNIQGVFSALPENYKLVVHPWESRDLFLNTLSAMDLVMQISMSETFNIVAADAVKVGRPVIASDEISWMYPLFADTGNSVKAMKTLVTLWEGKKFFLTHNRTKLVAYSKKSESVWVRYMKQYF